MRPPHVNKKSKRCPPVKKAKKNEDEEIESDSSYASEVEEHDAEEAFETETAHEKHVRLTKQLINKALSAVDVDDEDPAAALTLQLQEEALQARGKLFVKVADHFKPISLDEVICLRGHKKSINCVCISADSMHLYSGGKDASIIKWSLSNFKKCQVALGGRRDCSSKHHTGPIYAIAISEDDKYLASGSADKSIIIWEPSTLVPNFRLRRHFAPVTGLSFRRQSHMLFSGDRSGRVCVWNMPLTEVLQDQGAATKVEVLSICGLSAERCISSSGFGGAGICLWKVEEELCVQYSVKNTAEHSVECVYAVNDYLFVGGSTSNTLYLWHVSRGSPICKVNPAHPPLLKKLILPTDRPTVNWVTAVAGLAGTDLIASGSSTGHVQLWCLELKGKAFSFNSDEPETAVADDVEGCVNKQNDGRLRMHHDTTQIKRITDGEFHLAGYVNSLAFSNNGKWLVAGVGQEHRLGRWDDRRKVNDVICLLPLSIPLGRRIGTYIRL